MNSQYLEVFLEEAQEHIQNLNKNLLELENQPSQTLIDEIFRSVHTLKGMAGTMGFNLITEISHEMEDLLQSIRSNKISVTPDIIDTLLMGVDFLEGLVGDIVENGQETQRDIQSFLEKIKLADKNVDSSNNNQEKNPKIVEDENFNKYEENLILEASKRNLKLFKIKVILDKDCLLKSARAFLVFKTLEKFGEVIKTIPTVQDIEDEKFDDEFKIYILTSAEKEEISKALIAITEISKIQIDELNIKGIIEKQDKDVPKVESSNIDNPLHSDNKHLKMTGKTLRVDIERLDKLMNLVSELIIIKTRLEDENETGQRKRETIEYLERITSNLHDAVMKVRMVPIENVFNRFPRVVHDLSRELSKKIKLVIEGAETELDRTIIDEIGDPLIHLIRNSADHGIEDPEERIAKGKPAEGIIKLIAYHDGNNVVIETSDDGKGIDVDKILETSIKKGLIDAEKAKNLKESEILSFMFEPGFSTKTKVTDVSGRGVGLDVVKTKIEALGGSVEIKTKKDAGTIFSIRLPLTLAIIQALMVYVGSEKYAIPLNSIKETIMIPCNEIKKVQNSEVTLLRGNVIPILRLEKLLDVETKVTNKDMSNVTVVIVKKGEKDVGLVVDSLIGQQEIVIKSLGNFLKNIKFIAGATILGDGTVALILDVNTLI